MSFWDKINADMQKSFKEGLEIIRKKAEILTEEGKNKFKIFDLKSKLQKQMADFGKMVYNLSAITDNPMKDPKVQAALDKIRKVEEQIIKLESASAALKEAKKKAAARKKAAAAAKKKAPVRKKIATKKTTLKKAPAKKRTAVKKAAPNKAAPKKAVPAVSKPGASEDK